MKHLAYIFEAKEEEKKTFNEASKKAIERWKEKDLKENVSERRK